MSLLGSVFRNVYAAWHDAGSRPLCSIIGIYPYITYSCAILTERECQRFIDRKETMETFSRQPIYVYLFIDGIIVFQTNVLCYYLGCE